MSAAEFWCWWWWWWLPSYGDGGGRTEVQGRHCLWYSFLKRWSEVQSKSATFSILAPPPAPPPRLLFPLPVLLSPLHTPSRETDMKVMKQYSEGRIEWFSQQFAEALLHPVSRHPGLPREPLTGGSDLDLTCWLSSLASLIG